MTPRETHWTCECCFPFYDCTEGRGQVGHGSQYFYFRSSHGKIQQWAFALKHAHAHTHIQIWIFYSDTWNSLTWAPFVGRNGKCAQHIQLARREFELMLCELYLWGKKANHNLPFPHINPEKHPLVFFFGNISLMALFKGPNHLCEEILRAVYIFKINMLLQYSSLKSTEIYILLCYRK